jgi:DNA-binding LacI/PurR family transcriptional regulator
VLAQAAIRAAVDRLEDRASAATDIILPLRLVIRGSSTPPGR